MLEILEERRVLAIAVDDDFYVRAGEPLQVNAANGVFTNDQYSPTSAVLTKAARNGAVQLNSDGSFTYTPDTGFTGMDWFEYSANGSSPATVTLEVRQDLDWADHDQFRVAHDRPFGGNVQANDEETIRPVSAILQSSPSHGVVVLNTNGTFTYTPAAGYVGADQFSYLLDDGLLQSPVATVALTVANSAPQAGADALTTPHNNALSLSAPGVLRNDTDIEGDSLTVSLVSGTSHGSLVLNSNGSIIYTPQASYVGSDSFVYRVSDGLYTDEATATIDVINRLPVLASDQYHALHDQALIVSVADGLLVNDSDFDGDTLTASLQSSPAHGSVSIDADGSFSYVPNGGYVGSDSFYYQVSDSYGQMTGGLATISVTNLAPAGTGDTYLAWHDHALAIAVPGVLSNDDGETNETLIAQLVTGPTHGALTLNANGSFVYSPAVGYVGPDSFVYRVSDGLLTSPEITVELNVVDLAPTARSDDYELLHDQAIAVTAANGILANDSGDPGETLSVILVAAPEHGTLTLQGDGSFVFTPETGYEGIDGFTYRASDGAMQSTPTTVRLLVENTRPTVEDDSYIVSQDTALNRSAGTGIRANDWDDPGDTTNVEMVESVQHGTLVLNNDGSFNYTPSAGFVGVDSFRYRLSDGLETSRLASVRLETTNLPVLAVEDQFTAAHDRSLSVNAAAGVLTNDFAANGLPLTAVLVGSPAHGSVTLNADGSFAYSPSANYVGTDEFTYKVTQGSDESAPTTVRLNVVNKTPLATPDTFRIPLNSTANISAAGGVLANDSDDTGESLTAILVSAPWSGSLSLAADGSFTYTPQSGFTGNVQFSYKLSDGLAESSPVTVTLEIFNNAPHAHSETYHVAHGEALDVDAESGLLANDEDDAGQTLTASLASWPSHGSVSVQSDGSFVYTPYPGFVGVDQFAYLASDGALSSSYTTVVINVTNTEPIAGPDNYRLQHDEPLVVSAAQGVGLNDADSNGDNLTVQLMTGAQHGSLALNADGSFTYTPYSGFTGVDSFTYRATDGAAQSNEVLVSLTVLNQDPIAQGDTYQIPHDEPLVVDVDSGVLANDADFDRDSLTINVVSSVSHGSLSLNSNGSFTYVPYSGFVGSDSFQYRLFDGAAYSSTVEGLIEVVNSTPEARDDVYRGVHDAKLRVRAGEGILANDQDNDRDDLTITILSYPAQGQLSLQSDGSFSYTPATGFVGEAFFTYRLSDGAAVSETATVRLDITNSLPIGGDDNYRLKHDSTLAIDAGNGLRANDFDAERDPLTLTVLTQPSHGSLSVSANGSFTYVPGNGYVGIDQFTYQLYDGANASGPINVSLTVTNSDPVAAPHNYLVNHDETLTVAAANGLKAGSIDFDEDTLALAVVSGPSHGSLTVNSDGSFQYVPAGNFVGEDTFTYSLNDGAAVSQSQVSIRVLNTPPWAVADSYSVLHDHTLVVAAANGILTNDRDFEGDSGAPQLVSNVSHGSLSLNADGSFTYVPTAGFIGNDQFSYHIADPLGDSNTATVNLSVTNQTPTAGSLVFRVGHDGSHTENNPSSGLLSNSADADGDTRTLTIVSGPTHGTLTGIDAAGRFTYTPTANFVGRDEVTYRVGDGASQSPLATITFSVENTAAKGAADFYATSVSTTLNVTAANGVLRNDLADSTDNLQATLDSGPSHGSVTLNSDGSFSYTPNSSYVGSDSFSYVVSDGLTQSAAVTVSIEVGVTGTTAIDDEFTVKRNGSNAFSFSGNSGLLANDYQTSGGQIVVVSSPAHGTLSYSGSTPVSYTPTGGYNGVDSFTYLIRIGGVDSNTASVTLQIPNGANTAVADNFRIQHDHALTVAAPGLLGNDYDENNDPLTPAVVSGPAHGTLTLNTDGSFTYTPTAGYVGPDSFSYEVTDGDLMSQPAVVNLDVWNNAPNTHDDGYRVHHDSTLTVPVAAGVLGNDTKDPDETLTAILVAGPAHGTLSLSSDGSFIYTPNAGYTGVDAFTYKSNDGVANGNVATVAIEVWNMVPVGTVNLYHIHHDSTLSVGTLRGVLTNDLDRDGDTLTATLFSLPAHAASFVLGADGSFTYVPLADYVGPDGFTYMLSDGAVIVGPISVAIDVWNTLPSTNGESYRTHHSQLLSVGASDGLLANDWDKDLDPLAVTLNSNVAHGVLALQGNGAFDYTPNAGYVGADSFTYRITDGVWISAPITVSLAVRNSSPVANTDSYSIHHDSPLTDNVKVGDWDGDADATTAALVGNVSHGVLNFNNDGSFTYTPAAGYVGSDSFSYVLNDGAENSQPTTVTIDVWNHIPKVHPNSYATPRGQALTKSAGDGVMWDDIEWDGDTKVAQLVSSTSHGSLTLNNDGSFTYTPNSNYTGADSFVYRVFDGAQYSESATVSIAVLNHAPNAFDDKIIAHHGQSTHTGNVTTDDWDPEGSALQASVVYPVSVGTLSLQANGNFTFTPPSSSWTGVATFTYKVSDGSLDSEPATVTIDVRNKTPLGLEDSYRIKHDTSLNANGGGGDNAKVTANDFDADNDTLQAYIVTAPTHAASFTLNQDGSFNYTPQANFAGEDSFTYRVWDGAAYGGPVQVQLLVDNSAPIGRMDLFKIPKTGTLAISAAQLKANDIDFDGDSMTVEIVQQPTYGSLSGSSGSWTYDPNFIGDTLAFDSFKYVLKDGVTDSQSEPVLVVITLLDDEFGTYNDEYRVKKGATLTVGAGTGVLANDWTTASDPLQATLVSSTYNGALSLNQNGSFTYTPYSYFTGTDSFTYKIKDGKNATVSIKVVGLDPQADSYTVYHDRRLAGSVLGNDTFTSDEAHRAVLQGSVSTGTLDFNPDGTFLYTPPQGYTGTATFTYKTTNGIETSSSAATVTINVTNRAPSANSDYYSTNAQQPIVVDFQSGVLANDSDDDSDVLKATLVSGVSGSAGSLTLNDDGSFTFIPNDNFKGSTSFTYKASDGLNETTQTVSLNVYDSDPYGSGQSYSTYHDEALVVGRGQGLLKGASDEFKHQLTAIKVSNPSHGTASVNSDGSFTYTPSSGYVGSDSFTFQVRDQAGNLSYTQTANIYVNNVLSNGPWRALPLDQFRGSSSGYGGYGGYGGTVSGDVLDVQYDIDGDPLSVSLYGSPSGVTLSSDGSFSYTGYGGSFGFLLSDGLTTSGPYWVNVYFGYGGTASTDFELSPGESFYTGGRCWVYNAGPGTVQVTGYSGTSASIAPVSGNAFSVSVNYGHGTWSGAASESLSFYASGDATVSAITGNLYVSAGGNISNLTGKTVSAYGDNIGNITASEDVSSASASYGGWYGGYGGSAKWSASSGIGVIGNITATRDINSVSATQIGTVSAGRDIGTINAYSLSNSITAARDIDWISAAREISSTITATSGDIGDQYYYWYYYGAIYAGRNISGSITAGGRISEVESLQSISGNITAGSAGIGYVNAGENISSTIDSGGNIYSVNAGADITSAASIEADGYLGAVQTGWDELGSIEATGQDQGYGGYGGYGGSIGSVIAGRDITNSITGTHGIGSITAGRTMSATVSATQGAISSVQGWQINGGASITAGENIGTVTATRSIDATIDAGTSIGTITAGRSLDGTITAGTDIGTITVKMGANAEITATAGNISTVNIGHDFAGSLTAGNNISEVVVGQALSANLEASNDLLRVRAGLAISGTVKAEEGDIDYVYAGKDISGDIDAGDDILTGIAAGQHLTGDVTAGDDIAKVAAGQTWKYSYYWWYGYYGFVGTGGDIYESSIHAGGSIGSVSATRYNGFGGTIGSATITADTEYISSVTADGNIDAQIQAETYIDSVGNSLGYGGYGYGSSAGAGDVVGSIKAVNGYVGNVGANFGKISATVDAGTYITRITATHDITGNITAGTYIGSTQYDNGIESTNGKISGNIKAGTDIGAVIAGKHIEGSIEAGRDIDVVKAGTQGGGNVTKSVKATRDIGIIVAMGPWSESSKRDVWNRSMQPTSAQWTPNDDKPTGERRAKPGMIPNLAAAGGYGNVQGKVTAEDIGSITAFGNIEDSVTATKTLGTVWALGKIQGDLKSSVGGITAQAWDNIDGSVSADGTITLKTYGNVGGKITSNSGGADVTAWKSIKGDVTGDKDVKLWAYDDAKGNTVSSSGSVAVSALKDITGKIKSALKAVVIAQKVASKGIVSTLTDSLIFGIDLAEIRENLAFLGKTWLISLGDVKADLITGIGTGNLFGSWNDISVLAWGNVDIKSIWGKDVNIWAAGDVKVNQLDGYGAVNIEAANVSGRIGGDSNIEWNPETVVVHAAGNMDADIISRISIDVLSLGAISGDLTATHDANAWIGAVASQEISGTVHAKSSVGLKTWGAVSGDITSDTGAINVQAGREIKGKIVAGGYIELVSWKGGITSSEITANDGYIDLMSGGNVNSKITAKGDVTLEVWKDLQGKVEAGHGAAPGGKGNTADILVHGNSSAEITSSHDVNVEAFGTVRGQITATNGSAAVVSFGGVNSATVTAKQTAEVISWSTINNTTIKSTAGDATAYSHLAAQTLTLDGYENAAFTGGADVKGTITARTKDAQVSAVGNIESGTTVTANQGNVIIFAGGNANLTATAGSAQSSAENSVSIAVVGTLQGTATAQGQVGIVGLKSVELTATSRQNSIDVFADGQLKGTYQAATGIAATTLGTGSGTTEGSYKTTAGDADVVSLTAFNGTVDGGSNAHVSAFGDLAGTVKGGNQATANSTTKVSATVTAGVDASVAALSGDVTGAVTANYGDASVIASGQVTGQVKGYKDAIVTAMGNVSGTVTATSGDAKVTTFGALSGSVSAGHDAEVYSKGTISGPISATNDATVTTDSNISSTVNAGNDALVLAVGPITGSITGTHDATVSTLAILSGSVTATTGDAAVLAGGSISGPISAGRDATIWTRGSLNSTVNAGRDADVSIWGATQGTVHANRDAKLWSKGTISAAVSADRNLLVTSFGAVTANTSAGNNADVTVYADLSGNVTGGNDAVVWVSGELTGNVTATSGNVDATSVGDFSGDVTAGTNATVTTFGTLDSTIEADENANITVFGDSADLEVTATNQNADVRVVGTITGEITAGTNVDVLSLSDMNGLDITAGQNAVVAADGTYDGEIDATAGDVNLFATDAISGEVTAGHDLSVGSLQNVTATLTATGSATVFSLAQATGSNISGVNGVFVWAQGGLSGLTLTSAAGLVSALSNGAVTGITANGATGVTIASIGAAVDATVTSNGNVALFGQGVTAGVTTTGDLYAVSFGALNLPSLSVGGNATLMATGMMTVTGQANGDVDIEAYGGLAGNIVAGDDLSAWSLQSITANLTGRDTIGSVVTFGSLLGNLSAGGAVADLDPFDGHGVIRGVYIWDDLLGTITATDFIGEVFVGNVAGPFSLVVAPVIGQISLGDRTRFVEDPAPPLADIAHFIALARNARQALLDLQGDFQASKVEFLEIATAATAGVQKALAEAQQRLATKELEAQATLQDIQNSATLAEMAAKAAAQQLLDNATVELESERRNALHQAASIKQEVNLDLTTAQREAQAKFNQAQDHQDFVKREASKLSLRMEVLRSAQLDQAGTLKAVWPQVFVATFMDQMVEFGLDLLQEQLEMVAFVADFIPGPGNLISGIADGINAAIYAARGKWFDAAASVVAIIPFGTIAKKAGLAEGASRLGKLVFKQVGNGLQAVSKFVKIPPLGPAAKNLACFVKRQFGLPGCFVAGTEVVMGGQPVGSIHETGGHLQFSDRNLLVVTLVGVGLVGYVVGRKLEKRRSEEQAILDEALETWSNDEFANDFELPDGICENPVGASVPQESFSELCDKLFNGEEDLDLKNAARVPAVDYQPTNSSAPFGVRESEDVALATIRTATAPAAGTIHSASSQTTTANRRRPQQTPEKPSKWFGRGSTWWLAACILLASVLGLMPSSESDGYDTEEDNVSATAASLVTKPIEQVRVGDRVRSENPTDEVDLEFGEVDQATWLQLTLRAPRVDGNWSHVVLLRPASWVEEHSATVGGKLEISVDDCGIEGDAEVLAIDPCPPIMAGSGRVVTGTYRHEAAQILDLHVEGLEKPIGTTPNHLFWSADREEFIPAGGLQPGERLDDLVGKPRVMRAVLRDQPETVYNLEVEVDHLYHVGPSGILVHNGKSEFVYQLVNAAGDVVYVGIAKNKAQLFDRLKKHAADPYKAGKFVAMQVIGRNLTHNQARTLEAYLIHQRVLAAQKIPGLIKKSDSIAKQLKKAGLLNKNRGRIPSRWLKKIPLHLLEKPLKSMLPGIKWKNFCP